MKYIVNSQNLFEAEKLRNELANSRSFKEFKDSYKWMVANEKDLNTAKFWNKLNYRSRDNLVMSPVYKDKINSVVRMIRNGHGNLLDVGFGSAEIERLLQGLKFNLFGIDIAFDSVKRAMKELNGTYKTGDIYKIPFTDKSMDIVLALDVIEHLPTNKTFAAYSELSRVLKTGGKIVVSVPLNEGLEEMLKRGENPNGHLRAYSPSILKTELVLSGFKILGEHYLYAFKTHYLLKKLFITWFPIKIRQPNLMIVLAQKL
jgi:2-polyprenyl-3-methyl-5-hydroxy-6-metoxy-1,4-benzoquinol methylase